jgi:ATP-dependent Clp protease ATP-binding subunit ClpA
MSAWIRNLKTALEHKEVIILHGNVRDKYIDLEKTVVYDNLTELLQAVSRELPLEFSRLVFYDIVGQQQVKGVAPSRKVQTGTKDFSSSTPSGDFGQNASVAQVLNGWKGMLSATASNVFTAIFYLDKLVSYKQTGYTAEERDTILRLEKLVENITPNNRLVMVALQDTMVPLELYTNSPRVSVALIPEPDKEDRAKYLRHRLGEEHEHLDFVADLTDGLFLRDLDNIASVLRGKRGLSTNEVRRQINKYRIGEQKDHWGSLDIEKLNNAEKWFIEQEGVKGQDDAVRKVVGTVSVARAGLSGMASGNPSKPKGVLFFAGTSGVGKTFLAKKLAKLLFGSEDAFVRFDMSEFMEGHTVSRLIGSPPGYIGYEEGGMLTSAIKEKPFSVVLFDEIEKAHPRILDIFLQILGDGRLTDSRGQTVFFTETVIIFTSNIGTRTRDSQGKEIDESTRIEAILTDSRLTPDEKRRKTYRHFEQAVRNYFRLELSRPELLNRIGFNIVPFNSINDPDMQKKIVRSHLNRIKSDFEDKFRVQKHSIAFDDSVVDYLTEKYRDDISRFGGTAITNVIEDEAMRPLAKKVLKAEHNAAQGIGFSVTVRESEIMVLD